MAQPPRTKHPLDILQGMINGILIETGRALKTSTKDGRRALSSNNPRLQSTIPPAVETFQQALDELECDILRAKSVLSRDLEEARLKRIALETPANIPEEAPQNNGIATESTEPETQPVEVNDSLQATEPEPSPIKEERQPRSPEKQQLPDITQEPMPDEPKDAPAIASGTPKGLQIPSPPASYNEANTTTNPIGLGINTEAKPDDSDPTTNGPQDPSIDSLFDIPDNDDTNIDLNFDSMDFSFNTNTNTQTQDQPQTQNDDFDLSAFGNTSPDFNLPSLNPPKDANSENIEKAAENKPVEDLLNLGANVGGGDSMDLDLNLDMVGAEDSAFDDMFFDNEGGMSAGGEMEHDTYDSAFFGLS
ncbi:uncharacterized protein BP5553_03786 [Venustampulla echinocandica]|uniref:Uncharacterized protein n=1 Tax=Venustampulla echinocandica TaxID=2656787 RepID=A0A370TV96_9HELO|nr:uncharacterized protein BP5553_03786 [Venustampulla echinocandica]RDL39446.1 hypothetical protein BP5553_03786 [Venustampulla echinocandica]